MTHKEFMAILEYISHGWIPEEEIEDLAEDRELYEELLGEFQRGEE